MLQLFKNIPNYELKDLLHHFIYNFLKFIWKV